MIARGRWSVQAPLAAARHGPNGRTVAKLSPAPTPSAIRFEMRSAAGFTGAGRARTCVRQPDRQVPVLPVARLKQCRSRWRHRRVTHGPRDDVGRAGGGREQGGVIEMCIDRGGAWSAVTEQVADGGEADPMHDALRGIAVPGVMEAGAVQSGRLAHLHPERGQPRGGEVAREHAAVVVRGQRRQQPRGLCPEPQGART